MIHLKEPLLAHWGQLKVRVLALDSTRLLLDINTFVAGVQTLAELAIDYGSMTFKLQGKLEKNSNAREAFFIPELCSEALLKDLLGQLRKNHHIDICQKQDVEASDRFTGFSQWHFVPNALPELSMTDLVTGREFCGLRFSYPFLITGMTGGTLQGEAINANLAQAAQAFNIPMGIGSQRLALENPQHAKILQVKKKAPKVFLIGNLGANQLVGADALDLCRRCVDMVEADALAIHLNVLQECLQIEGDKDFKGFLHALETVSAHLEVPLIVKEVGSGIAIEEVQRLIDVGIKIIDIGGRGGTSWGYIEGLRSGMPEHLQLASEFRDWGIPTAFNLVAIKKHFPDLNIICTGGVRSGLMIAKGCALGAQMVGVGLPFFKAALESEAATLRAVEQMTAGLKISMLATGSKTIHDLSGRLAFGMPYQNPR